MVEFQSGVAARFSYRPDIQILRAVAVVLVLLFHLRVSGFSSGFLGVDVFFVISGYLMQKLYGDGVGAADFYRRRARRLLPAYFGLVAAVLVISFLVVLPGEFNNVAEQGGFAAILSSNVGFWLQASYFESGRFTPLLHLWSLGVEAQFYLLFPLLVRLDRRLLIALAAISLFACLAAVTVSPKLAFFLLPFRLWESTLGMLAARLTINDRRIGLAALGGIFLCLLIPIKVQSLSILFGHPALSALIVSLLTAATLVCRLPSRVENSLPGRAAQKLGDVSYSLYLAHFPVIVLLNYQPFTGTHLGLTPWTLPLIAAATLALYFGLERTGPKLFSVRSSVMAALAIWSFALVLPKAQLAEFDERQQSIFAALDDQAGYRCGKLFRMVHPTQRFCPIGKGEPILLAGDSYSDAIKVSFAKVAERHGFGAFLSVDKDPLMRPSLSAEWLRREADSRGARWIFLHYAESHLSPAMLESARRTLGNRLILIEPTPEYSESVPKNLYEGRNPTPVPSNLKLLRYLQDHPDIRILRIGAFPVQTGGRPTYFDVRHLTLTGARRLEPIFDAWFDRFSRAADPMAGGRPAKTTQVRLASHVGAG